jgi:Flp pilus assembly protein TadG
MKRLSDLRGQAIMLLLGYCRASAPGRAGAQFRSGGRLRASLRSGGEGQSAVEFAFVVPIMLAVMMGIYAVGIITFNDVALNNAVDTGATSLTSVGSAPSSNMGTGADYTNGVAPIADPCQFAFTQMTSATSNLIPNNITVTYYLTYLDLDTNTQVNVTIGPYTGAAANTCTGNSADFATGGHFTIVATYPCTLGLYGFNVPGCKITATASEFIYTS